MATKHLLFPILGERTGDPKTYIPWAVIAPHEGQALKNHQQTLERLAQRGGLDPAEAVAVLEDRDFRLMPYDRAHLRLGELVAGRVIVAQEPDMVYMPVPRCDSCGWWKAFDPDLQPAKVGGIVDALKGEGLMDDAELLGRLTVPLGDCTLFEVRDCEPVHEEALLQVQRTGNGQAVAVTTGDFGCVQWKGRDAGPV